MEDIDALSDDYVASILVKDARNSSVKYSALGVGAFLPSKVPAKKPKPNTRFLRNIIQETDSHNAALLSKEAAEAQTRLHNLVKKESRSGADIRRRQLGHITAYLTGGPPKRRYNMDETEPEKLSRKEDIPGTEYEESMIGKIHDNRRERRHRGHNVVEESKEAGSSRYYDHKRRHRRSEERLGRNKERTSKKLRTRSPSFDKHESKKSKHNADSYSCYSATESSHRHGEDAEREHNRSRRHRRFPSSFGEDNRKKEMGKERVFTVAQSNGDDEDSDPLEDIIGPLPPRPPTIRSRGRGTISSASGIDFRFSSNYDPVADVAFDPGEGNDWDQALEALRDRQKWKQQGADRLRSAGFTEEDIQKWEKGEEKGDRNANDVKWAKRGEAKEWDKGKVFSVDGEDELLKNVDLHYGRLKGT